MLHVLYSLSIGSQCYICGTCYARCIISAIMSSKCMFHVLHMLRPPIPAPCECCSYCCFCSTFPYHYIALIKGGRRTTR